MRSKRKIGLWWFLRKKIPKFHHKSELKYSTVARDSSPDLQLKASGLKLIGRHLESVGLEWACSDSWDAELKYFQVPLKMTSPDHLEGLVVADEKSLQWKREQLFTAQKRCVWYRKRNEKCAKQSLQMWTVGLSAVGGFYKGAKAVLYRVKIICCHAIIFFIISLSFLIQTFCICQIS